MIRRSNLEHDSVVSIEVTEYDETASSSEDNASTFRAENLSNGNKGKSVRYVCDYEGVGTDSVSHGQIRPSALVEYPRAPFTSNLIGRRTFSYARKR